MLQVSEYQKFSCAVCKNECTLANIAEHPCMQGYKSYVFDENYTFYPQCSKYFLSLLNMQTNMQCW